MRRINQRRKKSSMARKASVVFLVSALIASTVFGTAVYADKNDKLKTDDGVKTTSRNAVDAENVYLIAGSDGRVYQKIVSERGNLHYDGYEDAELPFTADVKYFVNGKERKAEKTAGAKGEVEIRIKFRGNLERNGVLVPFAAMAGTVFENEGFDKITAQNARVIDDGNRTIVAGAVFPGAKEGLDSIDMGGALPGEIVIKVKTDNFKMNEIYVAATNDMFTEITLNAKSDLGDIMEQLSKLEEGTEKLISGTKALDDGAEKLKSAMKLLSAGTEKLNGGAAELCSGTEELMKGSSALSEGAGKVSSGAGQLSEGAGKLKEGTQQLSSGLDTLVQQGPALAAGASQIADSVFAEVNAKLQAAGFTVPLTKENYQGVLEQAIAAAPAPQAGMLSEAKSQLDNVMTFSAGVSAYVEGTKSAALGAAALDENAGVFEGGLAQVAAGASELSEGQKALDEGIKKVNEGAYSLHGGTELLCEKEAEMLEGVSRLSDGADELCRGVRNMAEEGAGQLDSLPADKLVNLKNKIKDMADAAREYRSFNGKDEYENVNFILKIEPPETK